MTDSDLQPENNRKLLEFGVKQNSNEPDFIFDPETGEPNDF